MRSVRRFFKCTNETPSKCIIAFASSCLRYFWFGICLDLVLIRLCFRICIQKKTSKYKVNILKASNGEFRFSISDLNFNFDCAFGSMRWWWNSIYEGRQECSWFRVICANKFNRFSNVWVCEVKQFLLSWNRMGYKTLAGLHMVRMEFNGNLFETNHFVPIRHIEILCFPVVLVEVNI